MKAVVDTNVLVSGLLKPSGIPGRIVGLILDGELELLVDASIVAEYRRVLNSGKFPFTNEQVEDFLNFVELTAEYIERKPAPVKLPDKDDQKFLEVCRSGNAKVLITGNLRHFPNIIEAMSPRAFVETN